MDKADIVLPAEWAPHAAIWSSWPSNPDLWTDHKQGAREQMAAFFQAIMADGAGEPVNVLVNDAEARASAEAALVGTKASIIDMVLADLWLRDTGPIFTFNDGELTANSFRFNGWGGKFDLEDDRDVSTRVAKETGAAERTFSRVLEGGSIDFDGAGRLVTTRQCVLNSNRGEGHTQAAFEAVMADAFAVEQVIWLDEGLSGDDTDGHVDNLARFVAPGKVITMKPSGADDPNTQILANTREQLLDQGIEVVLAPSPGRYLDDNGAVAPASYMNFLVTNTAVVMPMYGTPWDEEALSVVGAQFPGRKAVGLPANHILSGGGSFHCITQQQPLPPHAFA